MPYNTLHVPIEHKTDIPKMDGGNMGEGDKQEQVTQGSSAFEAEAEEEGSDQGEVMYEDDILEEIEDDALPENGLHN